LELNRVGEIILLKLTDSKKNISKPKPAVILSDKGDNSDEYLVAYISSDIRNNFSSPYALTFKSDNLEFGKIKSTSLIRVDIVAAIDDNFFYRTGFAKLDKEKIKEMLHKWAQLVTTNYYNSIHRLQQTQTFIPNQSRVPYSGRVFDEKEMINLVDSSLNFWLTSGSYTAKFEKEFAKKLGVRYCSVVNSGSSANLVAFMALTSPKLGRRRICKGDEVITLAAGFPTTINPIVQFGAIPVFVDVTFPTYNIDVNLLEEALSEKTKAVMIAHTLGNPFDVETVLEFCKKHNLWLVEDNCDALGSLYRNQKTGSFGDIATSSFYPPHHITMGEGGAVYTKNSLLKVTMESFRDWGRDCYCLSGKDNTCKKRFEWELGTLPKGYDHKYIFSHFGYNLKATDMQAAIGCAQLEKLDFFTRTRQKNWQLLYDGLKNLEDFFILPEATMHSEPSWFGFLLTLKKTKRLTRDKIVKFLEANNIQTRMLFAGNMVRHPAFDAMREQKEGYRVVGNLKNTDSIMNNSFWIGVYPGMKQEMLEHMINIIQKFCSR